MILITFDLILFEFALTLPIFDPHPATTHVVQTGSQSTWALALPDAYRTYVPSARDVYIYVYYSAEVGQPHVGNGNIQHIQF